MYRALAAVAIVAIVAIVVLVIFLVSRWQKRRGERVQELTRINRERWELLCAIREEARLQIAAGHASHDYTLSLINEHERKELLA